MRYVTETGIAIVLERDATDLQIYKACRAVGLLRNQTHSALVYGAYDGQITIDRARDGQPLVTLDRVKIDS